MHRNFREVRACGFDIGCVRRHTGMHEDMLLTAMLRIPSGANYSVYNYQYRASSRKTAGFAAGPFATIAPSILCARAYTRFENCLRPRRSSIHCRRRRRCCCCYDITVAMTPLHGASSVVPSLTCVQTSLAVLIV